MIGNIYGSLKVKEQVGKLKRWICVCSCGIEKNIKECNLLSGHTSSCGCKRKDTPKLHMLSKAIQKNRKLMKGDRFGRLVILKTYPTIALCDCGNTLEVKRTASLFNKDMQSCGCLNAGNAKEKQRKLTVKYRTSKGFCSNTPMTPINKAERNRFKKTLAPLVMARDDYTCALCNERGGVINVHHIIRWSDDVSLRFEQSNLVTLCKACHIQKAHDGNVHKECNKDIARVLTEIVNKRMDL